jgi:hypothetical protein
MAFRLAALAVIASGAAAITIACSNDSGNSTPQQEGGVTATGTTSGTSSGTSTATSSGTTTSTSSSGTTTSSSGTASGTSSGVTDGAACTPDASPNCNSCATVATDPFNTCSQYTASCVKFAHTVPTHPML